eukprot:scaffold31758_cov43-Phaeocystis_antarctica.AAC.1
MVDQHGSTYYGSTDYGYTDYGYSDYGHTCANLLPSHHPYTRRATPSSARATLPSYHPYHGAGAVRPHLPERGHRTHRRAGPGAGGHSHPGGRCG